MSQSNDSPSLLTPALSAPHIALDQKPDHVNNGPAAVTPHAIATDLVVIQDAQGKNEPAVEPVFEPVFEPVIQPITIIPQRPEQESDAITTAPSNSLENAPSASSPSSAGMTTIETPTVQPTQDARFEIMSPSETTTTNTTLTEASSEQPSKDDKETIPTEAILTQPTTAQPIKNAKGTKRVKATIAEAIRTLPVRKVKETKRAEATLANTVKAGPARKAKETNPVKAPVAEAATARPFKRAKIMEPSEGSIKTTAERPSKRVKGSSSSVQDNGAHADVSAPAQQAGQRGRSIAKPKPSKRVRKSSTAGAGVEKNLAIVQNQDEHDSKLPLTVVEETGLSARATEQSPSTHVLAADNLDVARKSRRRTKAAPVDEIASRQPLGRDEPIEAVGKQVIPPAPVAKRGRGRPRKVERADLIPTTNDPTTTPSGDSLAAGAPTVGGALQVTAPRRRGRPRSIKGVGSGAESKEPKPKKSSVKKQPTKPKPRQTGKAVYEDDDERLYEEAIKDRGVRVWETFPMDSNGCIDKWAQMLGVPMRTLPISEEKECLTFPFDMKELQATGSADRVRAFIFFGPDSLQREPPKGDTDSFAIPFLSQQSVGYGHAVDSCASLSFLNIAMNCPDILENGPASMQQLRATLDDEEKVQSIKHAWRVFDQSVMGEQVHEVHNRIAVAEDSVNEEHPPYNPKEHMRKTRYSQRKAQALQQDSSAASTSASEHEQNNAFHFTALMKIGGQVWELDSMETEPIRITSAEDADWHVEVSNYLQSLTKNLSTYQKNYNCRLIAVV
ncbi:hypothetical protein BGZ68_009714 [Mortierella alpina]|nr:hypothetical protein BGZ68_009714 [Mortierella alpina]